MERIRGTMRPDRRGRPPLLKSGPTQLPRIPKIGSGAQKSAKLIALQRAAGNSAVVHLLTSTASGAGDPVAPHLDRRPPHAIQRLAAYAPPTGADEGGRLSALKAHAATVGAYGTFLEEAEKVAKVVRFISGADGTAMLSSATQLKRGLNDGTLTAQAGEDLVKQLVDIDELWGGMTGLATLVKERFELGRDRLRNDKEYKRLKNASFENDMTRAYDAFLLKMGHFINVTDVNVFEKTIAFGTWYATEGKTLADVDLKKALKPPEEAAQQKWANSFFFPKVRTRLGLPGGSGQQLYTADKTYNNTYKWHISVAFNTIAGKQMVAIDRIHLSFKHQGGGGDKSVWFTVAGNNLQRGAGPHGGGPTATEITFAEQKVKAWAQQYTGFKVQW